MYFHEDRVYLFWFFYTTRRIEDGQRKFQSHNGVPYSKKCIWGKKLHGLVSFYINILKKFSGIFAPIVEIIKGNKHLFQWKEIDEKIFQLHKNKINK